MKNVVFSVFILAFSLSANASLVSLQFEASDFENCCTNVTEIPQDLIQGSITWEYEDQIANIVSLVDISLVIDGYSFDANEVGFDSFDSDFFAFGGVDCGVSCILASGNNDFYVAFDFNEPSPLTFQYGTQASFGVWIAQTTSFQLNSVTVSEPGSLYFVLTSLLGVLMITRKKRVIADTRA